MCYECVSGLLLRITETTLESDEKDVRPKH